MSSESVCQVARSWVDVGSFHTRLFGVVRLAMALVREFLDTPSCTVMGIRRQVVLRQHLNRNCPATVQT
jgi:hypothetical protein